MRGARTAREKGGHVKLTKDDEKARRICSLALEFMNARAPVPSEAIAAAFYPDLSPDSFRRAFARDRRMLEECGIAVEERPSPGSSSSWAVDEGRSFARGAELDAVDALALEVACRPLLDEAGFPLSCDLRFALAKLNRAFAETDPSAPAGPARRESRQLAALRSCLVSQRAARVTYVDASGVESRRLLAPYGFFELRGVLYLVAARLDDGGSPIEGGIRTYRVERFSSVEEAGEHAFEVPEGFDVASWRRLPFQMGPTVATALFEVPEESADELVRATLGQGELARKGNALLWSVPTSSLEAAASWAVAHGLHPRAPQGLVSAWRHVLEGVLEHAS